jgi:hypothetical protein
VEAREDFHRLLQVIDRLRGDLRNVIVTGQLAEAEEKTLRDKIHG